MFKKVLAICLGAMLWASTVFAATVTITNNCTQALQVVFIRGGTVEADVALNPKEVKLINLNGGEYWVMVLDSEDNERYRGKGTLNPNNDKATLELCPQQ